MKRILHLLKHFLKVNVGWPVFDFVAPATSKSVISQQRMFKVHTSIRKQNKKQP